MIFRKEGSEDHCITEKSKIVEQEGNFNPSKDEKDHSFLLQLLLWFKQSFRLIFYFELVLNFYVGARSA